MPARDPIDRDIVRRLRLDGRMPNAALAKAVGLSPSACLRRLRALEQSGVIRGYAAITEDEEQDHPVVVIVEITLERQSVDYLTRFETAARKAPNIKECYLMSGQLDYVLKVEMRDTADYERIHKEQIACLPGVSQVRSNVAIRTIVRPRVRAKGEAV